MVVITGRNVILRGERMKNLKKHLIRLYVIITAVQPLLWIACPEAVHFFGASSLTYLFQYSLGNERRPVTFLALAIIPVLFAALAVSLFLFEKRKQLMPFLIVTGMDLIISLLILAYKIAIDNYIDIVLACIGLGVRLLFFPYLCYRRRELNT